MVGRWVQTRTRNAGLQIESGAAVACLSGRARSTICNVQHLQILTSEVAISRSNYGFIRQLTGLRGICLQRARQWEVIPVFCCDWKARMCCAEFVGGHPRVLRSVTVMEAPSTWAAFQAGNGSNISDLDRHFKRASAHLLAPPRRARLPLPHRRTHCGLVQTRTRATASSATWTTSASRRASRVRHPCRLRRTRRIDHARRRRNPPETNPAHARTAPADDAPAQSRAQDATVAILRRVRQP